MLRVGIILMALGLAGITGIAAYATIQACGVRAGWIDYWFPRLCQSQQEIAAARRLVDLRETNDALLREIRALEKELAGRQCEARFAPPVAPQPLPQPAPQPAPQPTLAPGIDEDAWRRGDLASLAGCWSLDSNYQARNRQTGVEVTYTQWDMCFDSNGNGTEKMSATNGTTCEGPISGRFAADGRLELREPGNLICSDNTYIYRRDLRCALSGEGDAQCDQRQPEINQQATVRLRRSQGD